MPTDTAGVNAPLVPASLMVQSPVAMVTLSSDAPSLGMPEMTRILPAQHSKYQLLLKPHERASIAQLKLYWWLCNKLHERMQAQSAQACVLSN